MDRRGVANVFAETPTFLRRNARAMGIVPAEVATRTPEPPSIDLGWGAYARPPLPPAAAATHQVDVRRKYVDSQVILRDLARFAGADFRSNAGKERAYQLLQGRSARFVPGELARAIIEHNDLDPKVYDRLRERIKGAVDLEGGATAIAREFRIG